MRCLPLMLVIVNVILAVGLAACATPGRDTLTFAEVQTLNPGVSADWILQEFPYGNVSRWPDGKVQTIRYKVDDPHGHAQTLILGFDGAGRLCKKRYTGKIVRPPAQLGPPQKVCGP